MTPFLGYTKTICLRVIEQTNSNYLTYANFNFVIFSTLILSKRIWKGPRIDFLLYHACHIILKTDKLTFISSIFNVHFSLISEMLLFHFWKAYLSFPPFFVLWYYFYSPWMYLWFWSRYFLLVQSRRHFFILITYLRFQFSLKLSLCPCNYAEFYLSSWKNIAFILLKDFFVFSLVHIIVFYIFSWWCSNKTKYIILIFVWLLEGLVIYNRFFV